MIPIFQCDWVFPTSHAARIIYTAIGIRFEFAFHLSFYICTFHSLIYIDPEWCMSGGNMKMITDGKNYFLRVYYSKFHFHISCAKNIKVKSVRKYRIPKHRKVKMYQNNQNQVHTVSA